MQGVYRVRYLMFDIEGSAAISYMYLRVRSGGDGPYRYRCQDSSAERDRSFTVRAFSRRRVECYEMLSSEVAVKGRYITSHT